MRRLVPWWFWVSAASAVMTFAVWFSIPANAHPGPGDREVRRYAAGAAPAICAQLDAAPTVTGVRDVLAWIEKDSGFGDFEAGETIALAVQEDCPRFLPLLQRFVAVYGGQRV